MVGLQRAREMEKESRDVGLLRFQGRRRIFEVMGEWNGQRLSLTSRNRASPPYRGALGLSHVSRGTASGLAVSMSIVFGR